MLFYTRYFFKHKRPRFIPPGKIDESFYKEIKERLFKDSELKFESEIGFWKSYKYIFFVFIITISVNKFLLPEYI